MLGTGGKAPLILNFETSWKLLASLRAGHFTTWEITPVHIESGRHSAVGIATRYGLDGLGIESRCFSAPVQTGTGAHSASYTMGTGSFRGVKWPGCGVDHPSPSSAEVKERVELYLFSPFWVACPRVNALNQTQRQRGRFGERKHPLPRMKQRVFDCLARCLVTTRTAVSWPVRHFTSAVPLPPTGI
jgi:hypothetical protein